MFDDFRRRMSRYGQYNGDRMRTQTEMVMDATWMNSISTYPVVVHSVASGLPPTYESVDDYDEPLYAHFETKSNYNAGGNEPAYYLTFRPDDMRENPNIKVGSYVNIPNTDGSCSYWMIIHLDDDNLLVKCQILKINHTLKWISNGAICNILCILRGVLETNGIETAGQLSTVNSLMYVWCPTNQDSVRIDYNTRFLISDVSRATPLAWKTSRINDVGPTGITRISLMQDMFNDTTDNATLMLADYNLTSINIEEFNSEPQEFTIAYNGTKPTVKVGGYKTFTAQLPEENHFDIMWSVVDGDETYCSNSYDNATNTYGDYTIITTDSTMQLKVAQNYNLVGKVLTIQANCADGNVGSISVEVVS